MTDVIRTRLAEGETEEWFLVEGRHAVRSLLETEAFAVEALVTTGAEVGEFGIIAAERGIPVLSLSADEAAGLLGFRFHRGVLAIAQKPILDFSTWLREATPARLVVLENLADPGNVGTILRNAVAFGFDGVVCLGGGASPFNAKAVRASATAIFQVPVFREAALADGLSGITLIGTDVSSGAQPLDETLGRDLRDRTPLAVALGNEAQGLSEALVSACQVRVRIPISSRVESLNVASASAILLNALGRVA